MSVTNDWKYIPYTCTCIYRAQKVMDLGEMSVTNEQKYIAYIYTAKKLWI